MKDPKLTFAETMAALGKSKATIYSYVKAGLLTPVLDPATGLKAFDAKAVAKLKLNLPQAGRKPSFA